MKRLSLLVAALMAFASPAFATVTVTSPVPGATVSSPVSYVATATATTCAAGVSSTGIYVDNVRVYIVKGASLNTTLTLTPGTYNTVVQEWDLCGGSTTAPIKITVPTPPAASPGVVVTSPLNGSTVTSPVSYAASATSSCAQGVASMGIYVSNVLQYVVDATHLSTTLALNPGTYHTTVQAWNYCGSSSTSSATITVAAAAKTVTSIAVTPNPGSFAIGSTQQFTATATYSDNSTADVSSTAAWTSSAPTVATIDTTGLATGIASGLSTITATLSSISGSAAATVTVAPSTGVNIPTWHVDTNRSGLNAAETSLTPSNVSSTTFGKLFSYLVDGYAYGEPLLMSNVAIPNNGTHNVLYVATEHDSVYAFDADSYGTGAPLWQTSLLKTGETPLLNATILPYQGVTSTPVIDPTTNTIYVVSAQTLAGVSTFRLNALDITTGAQKFGGPVTISASVPGTNPQAGNGSTVTLKTSCVQRSALLLENGTVYFGMGGCATGWLLAYNAATLTQTAVFNASPNLAGEGTYASAGGIWMGSGGPVADSAGDIYAVTGNGPWDGQTAWSDTVLKFNPALQIQDYFTPQDYAYMNCSDADLASGGLLLIPGSTEVIAGGKMGKLYLLNTGGLGHEQPNDAGATQTLYFESDVISPYSTSCTDPVAPGATHTATINSYENFGTAAYFNGSVYLGVTPTSATAPAGVRQFTYAGGVLAYAGAYPADYTTPSIQENTRGTTPFISANGTSDGIVWMIDEGQPLQGPNTPTSATLRAYNATDLNTQLYNSSQNTADTPGYGIKFTSPVVANGKVYISTGHVLTTATTGPMGEIDVYGLK